MKLYLNGSDIRSLIIGDVDTSVFERFEVSPESYLLKLDAFLLEKGMSIGDVKELYFVRGPGSATSLRTLFSIVQVLAWVLRIPLYGVEKSVEVDDAHVLRQLLEFGVGLDEVSEFPFSLLYAHEARITATNKDSLRR